MNLPKPINKLVTKFANSVSQSATKRVKEILPMAKGMDTIARSLVAESAVLLKNEDVLPITENETVSLFGRCQINTFFVGYGSGGDVHPHYKVSFAHGLKNANVKINESLFSKYEKWCAKNPPDEGFWGNWPMHYEEMPIDEETVKEASQQSDKAIVFIGRAAGEDRENTLTPGSFYLTPQEEELLSFVSQHFEKWTVVLNIGNIIDFSWTEKYSVPCILIAWQGGMEAGNGLADILTGATSPSGALTDTISRTYRDIPSSHNFGDKEKNTYVEDIYVGYRYFESYSKDAVLFPFGCGLSYTSFQILNGSIDIKEDKITVKASVKNTGSVAGKKPVGLYVKYPEGILNTPALQLKAFTKTKLLSPGESEDISFTITTYDISSYDAGGNTGYRSAYVLQPGQYVCALGSNIRETVNIGAFVQTKTEVIKQLSEVSAVAKEDSFMRLRPLNCDGRIAHTYEPAPTRTVSLKKIIEENLPKSTPMKVGLKLTLNDVISGRTDIDTFISTLNYDELEAISRGDYTMNSPLGPTGNAGVFGGVLPSLRSKEIPPVVCTDGPSGIRLATTGSLLPSGTALASTWNTEGIKELYALLGEEMKERGTNILLAPGMNIHRNPLCGRNFEYFSEDPVISGYIAASIVEGLQSKGVSACPKHFACNNQEVKRTTNNSVVSERALREIYLKGFEICVKKAKPLNIMTSYNKINGVWGHYNYDLVTNILRNEWGFNGCVMTDWWMQSSASPEFPEIRDQAYRVRAGVNVLMPGGPRNGKKIPDGTLLESLGKNGGITLGELQKNAKEIVNMIILLKALRNN